MGPFIICAGVFVGLLIYMLARPKIRRPNPLKLSTPKLREGEGPSKVQSDSKGRRVKELNVIFQYNGHDFDAYEALGLPAGANVEMVKSAYHSAQAKADPGTAEFLSQAYQSILKNRS